MTDPQKELQYFFSLWEERHPELNQYTAWRQAKKNAKTLDSAIAWLKPERDKFDVVAPNMLTTLLDWQSFSLLEKELAEIDAKIEMYRGRGAS